MAKGKCLCGAVSFEATLPSKWVAHCHCTMCRRANGAAFVTWVGVEDSGCTLADPQGLFRRHRSSVEGERGFCSRCGSSFWFRSSRWPGEVHLTLANFDTPVDRAPQAHAFYDTHVDWYAVNDSLPKK
jgi:hypothetical protein